MGTRAAFGLVVNGSEKITYNHWDGYPEGLGFDLIDQLQTLLVDAEAFRAKAEALTALALGPDGEEVPPTPEQIERLSAFTDTSVSGQSTKDWYCLLRKTQGNLPLTLEAGLFADASNFPLDSLFCEWAYIANLDTNELEVFKGFQHEAHNSGRFAKRLAGGNRAVGGDTYYPVKLIGTIPFGMIFLQPDEAKKIMLNMAQ